jgi:murein DD-endopeptidase MepM/ murein hydrolase activator NlpD
MQTINKYELPIDEDKIIRIDIDKSLAHEIYENSIDYVCSVGTPIKAAADGIIIDVKDVSDKGGYSRHFEKYENFIEIRHENDEYSYYGHIKKGGSLVKIGDKVKAGQMIGYSGNVGWLANLVNEPYLHFMVGRYNYETMSIRWGEKLKIDK